MMYPASAILLLVLTEAAPAGEVASRPPIVADVNAARMPGNASARLPPLPISSPHQRSPLRTPAPHQGPDGDATVRSSMPSLTTMLSALVAVLGLFSATIWLLRRSLPTGARLLPGDVVEVLGRAPLAGRQQAHLVRCGNKLLLLAVSPAGIETLTEITDPLEVDRLAGLCQQAHPQSATAAFRNVFQQFGQRPARGFLGRTDTNLQLATQGFETSSDDAEADGD